MSSLGQSPEAVLPALTGKALRRLAEVLTVARWLGRFPTEPSLILQHVIQMPLLTAVMKATRWSERQHDSAKLMQHGLVRLRFAKASRAQLSQVSGMVLLPLLALVASQAA